MAIFFIKPLLLFIYGEKILSFFDPLKFMIGAAAFYFLRVYLSNILIAQDRQRFIFVTFCSGLAFNIFLNIDLIPLHGIAAGGIALLLSEIEMCGAMLFFIRKQSMKEMSVDHRLKRAS